MLRANCVVSLLSFLGVLLPYFRFFRKLVNRFFVRSVVFGGIAMKGSQNPLLASRLPSFSFMSGLLVGLTCFDFIIPMNFSPRRYRSTGVSGDWRAVGAAIRLGMSSLNERKHTTR